MTAANPNGMMVKDPSADSEIAPETVAIDEGQLETSIDSAHKLWK